MSRRKRYAFTLVELLVVISIIGMLMALLLPAVQSARERGRTMVCSSQIRELGTALISYETKKNGYPGYLNTLRKVNGTVFTHPTTGTQQGVSWAIMLFPNLERGTVLTALKGTATGSFAQANLTRIESFICPSDPPPTLTGTYLSYVVNGGCQDTQTVNTSTPRDWVDNGVFFDRYSDDKSWNTSAQAPTVENSNSYISGKDGTTQTLLLAENVDAGKYDQYVEEMLTFTWDPVTTVDTSSNPPTVQPTRNERRINNTIGGRVVAAGNEDAGTGGTNAPTTYSYFARPSSNHGDGVNVVYADGHTSFLSQDIEYFVYCMLMSPNGKGARTVGTSSQVLANSSAAWSMPFDDSWLRR